MRLASLLLLALVASSGTQPAALAVAPGMTAYGTTPQVRAYAVTVAEGDAGDPMAMVRITLTPRIARPVHVDFLTADSSAKEAQDYRRAQGRVTFNPGETEQTIGVRIIGDEVVEEDETFLLRLHIAAGAQLDTDSVTITILDDD